jgi:hypothetical protein
MLGWFLSRFLGMGLVIETHAIDAAKVDGRKNLARVGRIVGGRESAFSVLTNHEHQALVVNTTEAKFALSVQITNDLHREKLIDLIAKVLDDRVAQQPVAQLIEFLASVGVVLPIDLKGDRLADSHSSGRSMPQAFHGVFHGGPLGVQYRRFWRNKYRYLHGQP